MILGLEGGNQIEYICDNMQNCFLEYKKIAGMSKYICGYRKDNFRKKRQITLMHDIGLLHGYMIPSPISIK